MKVKIIIAFAMMLIVFGSCTDNTGSLGVDMMPAADLIKTKDTIYGTKTVSYPVGDSVLARTSVSYLGRFTDPETGTSIKSDFLTQFHCDETFALPDTIRGDSCTSIDIRFYYTGFIGDSLASFKIDVYELDKQLDPNANYYTNINPAKYYDVNKKPLTSSWYTLSDRTITDSLRNANVKNNTSNIRISLPTEVGNKIIRAFRQDKSLFRNTSAWLKSGLPLSKGIYVKLVSGDGAVASIDIAQLNIHFRYYDNGYAKDTTGYVQFAATEEVVQATRFENSELENLLEDKKATYIKSPAGIFTMATLPVEDIYAGNSANDTINQAKLVFTRYNDKTQSSFKLKIPQKLLMLRYADYRNGFFEKYHISDEVTSYLTTFNSSTNTYSYNNISHLISKMYEEKMSGTADENWNKVLLIPVEAIYDGTSSNTLVKLNHDFSISSSRLIGGEGDKVNLEVISTRFAK